jgi:hypothetical protein
MKCFIHHSSDAVAVCKNCGKALCPDCSSDVGNGIACRNACEDQVRALNELIQRNRGASQRTGAAYYRNAVLFTLLGLALVYFGVDALQTNRPPVAFMTIGTALIFFLAAFFNYSTGRKFIGGGR